MKTLLCLKDAARAALLLRTWFLNPNTRMNPHLNYAGGEPGLAEGRSAGIIDFRYMIDVIDSLGLPASYSGWTAQDQAGMTKWFSTHGDWLANSKVGHEEYNRINNHGTWHDDQTVALARFLNRPERARSVVETARHWRIDRQISADGNQPAEWKRAGWPSSTIREL